MNFEPQYKRLRNKVALITSTSGAGLVTAKRFAAEGADVIVAARPAELAGSVRRDLERVATVIELDVASEQNVARLFTTLGRRHGRLDILFLNAGSVSAFDDAWNLNVRSLWLALKHAMPLLADGAAVIVDTSIVDQPGFEAGLAYGATQGALRSIVRIAARELSGRNVRVNGISLKTSARSSEDVANAATFLASRESSFLTGAELAAGAIA